MTTLQQTSKAHMSSSSWWAWPVLVCAGLSRLTCRGSSLPLLLEVAEVTPSPPGCVLPGRVLWELEISEMETARTAANMNPVPV